MSELYDKIVANLGAFERLVARLPGFKGYQDKQARRHADDMLRDHLAREITIRLNRLIRIEKLILDNMGMAFGPRTREVKGKVQRYADRVKSATPGYSGMWAQMKVGPDELEAMYSFDEAQIIYLDKLDIMLDKLEEAALKKEGVEEVIYEMDGVISEALDAFTLREDVLTNLGKSL